MDVIFEMTNLDRLDDASAYLHAVRLFNRKEQIRYLQDFKIGKMKPYDQAVDALSSIKSLSKTDAVNLLKQYGVSFLKGNILCRASRA